MTIFEFGKLIFGTNISLANEDAKFAFRIEGDCPIIFWTDDAREAYQMLWSLARTGDYYMRSTR